MISENLPTVRPLHGSTCPHRVDGFRLFNHSHEPGKVSSPLQSSDHVEENVQQLRHTLHRIPFGILLSKIFRVSIRLLGEAGNKASRLQKFLLRAARVSCS